MGTIDSYNWSGARIRKEVLPAGQFFTSVQATWTVPRMAVRGSKEARSAAWIGLDGGTWDVGQPSNVLQAGTYHQVDVDAAGSLVPRYFAFFGLDDGSLTADPYFRFEQFKVSANDKIVVQLRYTAGSTTATADFTGSSISGPNTLPPQPISVQINSRAITGYTVEWIFERISKDNDSGKPDFRDSYYPLGRHDEVDFVDAAAVTDQNSRVSPDQGESIYMCEMLTFGKAGRGKVKIEKR